MLVTFKCMKVLFVKYIINVLPVDYLSFINKANNVASFFLKLLRLLNKQPFIAAHKKSTEYVGRNVGRTRHRWQEGAKLLSEKCCLI